MTMPVYDSYGLDSNPQIATDRRDLIEHNNQTTLPFKREDSHYATGSDILAAPGDSTIFDDNGYYVEETITVPEPSVKTSPVKHVLASNASLRTVMVFGGQVVQLVGSRPSRTALILYVPDGQVNKVLISTNINAQGSQGIPLGTSILNLPFSGALFAQTDSAVGPTAFLTVFVAEAY